MPYTVYKTDGTILTDILDSSIDKTTTDLALIGKNTSNYGEYFNANFVKLLENFADSAAPKSPLKGQIWYDSGEQKLKYYDGTDFKELNRPTVSTSEPTGLNPGDFWINNEKRQLYFNDGNGNKLAGPIYTQQQGLSGHEVATVIDTNGLNHIVVKLKIGNRLVGVFAKEAFTPNFNVGEGKVLASEGMANEPLIIGFNPANLGVDANNVPIKFKFNVTVKSAENLVNAFGEPVNVDEFVRTVGITGINGRLSITGNNPDQAEPNAIPLILGYSSNLSIEIAQLIDGDPTIPPVKIKNNVGEQDLSINVKKNNVSEEAIYIDASELKVGIWNTNPLEALDVDGNLNVRGNIVTNSSSINIVNSTATSVNFAGAGTAINIGAFSGVTTVRNNLVVNSDLQVVGGDLTGSSTFNLLNTGSNTINFGGGALAINIGKNDGTVTFNNDVVVNGLLNIPGSLLIDDILLQSNFITATTPNTDLNLQSVDTNINLKSPTIAEQNVILNKRLVFDGLGIISVPAGFTRNFEFLNEYAGTIFVGGDATRIDFGSDTGFTNINNNLQVYQKVTIGKFDNTPAYIDSNGDVANLFTERAKTVNIADQGDTVNLLYEAPQPGNPNPNLGKQFNVYAEETYFDGDITIKGADIKAVAGVPVGTIFNGVSGRITIGGGTSIIEVGGPGTTVRVGNSLKVGSVAGEIELVSKVSSGSITRGEMNVGETTAFFDMLPDFVAEFKLAASANRVEIGKGLVPENSNTIFQPSGTSGVNNTSHFPITILRNNLLVRNKLLLPTLDPAVGSGGAGAIFKNINNELEASIYVRMVGNSLAVAGDLIVSGNVVGNDQQGTAKIPVARINDLNVITQIRTDSTEIDIFKNNAATIHVGRSVANGVINLGSGNSTVNIQGYIKEKWTVVDGTYDAVAGDNLLIDTVAQFANVVVNLPLNPTVGDKIKFIDAGGVSVAYQLFITRNGKKINGANADINIQTPGRAFTLIYTGTSRGWCYDNA